MLTILQVASAQAHCLRVPTAAAAYIDFGDPAKDSAVSLCVPSRFFLIARQCAASDSEWLAQAQ